MTLPTLLLASLLGAPQPARADSLDDGLLEPGEWLTVVQGETPPPPVLLAGGTLELMGFFQKETQFPVGNASVFPGLEVLGPHNSQPWGVLRFAHCALLPGADPQNPAFYELPLSFSALNLELEDCWVYGPGRGLLFDAGHRGSLRATDIWFSAADTSVVSNWRLSQAWFTDCRFAYGHTGLAVVDAQMEFRRCEFVSLDTAIRVAGRGCLSLDECLFQSCRTMLSVSDSVVVTVDSSSFFEVGDFCLSATGSADSLDLLVSRCYFDSLSAPAERLLDGLPLDVIQDPVSTILQAPDQPLSVEIHVDDSEPLDSPGLPSSVGLTLSARLLVRSTGQKPIRPRRLWVYSLPLAGSDALERAQFLRLEGSRERWGVVQVDLEAVLGGSLPAGEEIILPLDPLWLPAEPHLLLGVVDDGFPAGAETSAPRQP